MSEFVDTLKMGDFAVLLKGVVIVIGKPGFISEILINIEGKNVNQYPYNLDVVKNLNKLVLDDKVTFIVGENGTGKSTLIEAIAIAYGFNSEGGSINFNFSTRFSSSDLYKNMQLKKTLNRPKDGYFLRAESFYNVATNIEEMDALPAAAKKIIESYGGKSLHEQSHGESFLSLFLNRFGGNGFYILDEPEAALSVQRQLTSVSHLHVLVKRNSQFVIATHSPIILSYPNAIIYEIREDGLSIVKYEDTEQYKSMKLFINNYPSILKKIMH